jgi:hypothetical protein
MEFPSPWRFPWKWFSISCSGSIRGVLRRITDISHFSTQPCLPVLAQPMPSTLARVVYNQTLPHVCGGGPVSLSPSAEQSENL